MQILKFGGTSVGSVERIKEVVKLITNDKKQKIVVLSAMSGTTNSLVEISDYYYKGNTSGALEKINLLLHKYEDVVNQLYDSEEKKAEAQKIIIGIFDFLRTFSKNIFTVFEEKAILAQGELLSTQLFQLYLEEAGIDSVLLPALDFMRINKNTEPDLAFITEALNESLEKNEGHQIYVTQGYICRNFYGEIDNLQRGGSDYTASLIGAAVKAEEIQIWTDIDGMHNNDPRYVEQTKPVPFLNFEEAAELAYFGAKILHPTCILPAKLHNIPVRLLNTMEPTAHGTLISNKSKHGVIEAIAAKDNITAIKIKSGRMLLAYGFMRKVFEIFEKHQTPIDMVTTSEVGVSVTIDDTRKIDDIVNDLKKFGTVTIDSDMVIICIVGEMPYTQTGFQAKIMDALQDIPIRMISYGGSNYNISVLIKTEDKKKALNALSKAIF